MNIAGLLALLKFVMDYKHRLGTLFAASLMNAIVFLALAVGIIAWKEGSFEAVYQVLFEPSGTAAEREKETRIAIAQAQLRQEVANMALIRQHLEGFLGRFPTVARVRIAVIHNGTVGVGDNHVWKYDVIAAVAANGRVPGPLTQNDPLEGWVHFLADLLAGKCKQYPVSAIGRTSARDRLDQLGVTQVLTCPVRTPSGELLGAMFTLFDRNEDLPKSEDLTRLMIDAANTATGLSYALVERRGR